MTWRIGTTIGFNSFSQFSAPASPLLQERQANRQTVISSWLLQRLFISPFHTLGDLLASIWITTLRFRKVQQSYWAETRKGGRGRVVSTGVSRLNPRGWFDSNVNQAKILSWLLKLHFKMNSMLHVWITLYERRQEVNRHRYNNIISVVIKKASYFQSYRYIKEYGLLQHWVSITSTDTCCSCYLKIYRRRISPRQPTPYQAVTDDTSPVWGDSNLHCINSSVSIQPCPHLKRVHTSVFSYSRQAITEGVGVATVTNTS